MTVISPIGTKVKILNGSKAPTPATITGYAEGVEPFTRLRYTAYVVDLDEGTDTRLGLYLRRVVVGLGDVQVQHVEVTLDPWV